MDDEQRDLWMSLYLDQSNLILEQEHFLGKQLHHAVSSSSALAKDDDEVTKYIKLPPLSSLYSPDSKKHSTLRYLQDSSLDVRVVEACCNICLQTYQPKDTIVYSLFAAVMAFQAKAVLSSEEQPPLPALLSVAQGSTAEVAETTSAAEAIASTSILTTPVFSPVTTTTTTTTLTTTTTDKTMSPSDNNSTSSCRHVFHRACMHEWLLEGKKQCPVCRDWFVHPHYPECMVQPTNNNSSSNDYGDYNDDDDDYNFDSDDDYGDNDFYNNNINNNYHYCDHYYYYYFDDGDGDDEGDEDEE